MSTTLPGLSKLPFNSIGAASTGLLPLGIKSRLLAGGLITPLGVVLPSSVIAGNFPPFLVAGNYSIIVPNYNTLTIMMGGGGGGAFFTNPGASGGASTISGLSLIAGGGVGSTNSAGGIASGGDTNINGNAGAAGPGGGGTSVYGNNVGAGGGSSNTNPGGGGGSALTKRYTPSTLNAPAPGDTLYFTVGTGGLNGNGSPSGNPGAVQLSWN